MIKINITSENRIHFWSIFTTALVGLFSLWMGISIQDDINTKNAKETQKLARYQMVEALYPKFSQYIDTGYYIFFDMLKYHNIEQVGSLKGEIADSIGAYYSRNQTAFITAMINSVNFMGDTRYYFGKEAQRKICQNNTSILFGLRMLADDNTFLYKVLNNWKPVKDAKDSIVIELCASYYAKNVFSFRESANDYIYEKCNKFQKDVEKKQLDSAQVVSCAVYDFIFQPYIDNYNVYTQELMPSEEVSSHIGKHILILVGCILLGLLLSIAILKHVFGVQNLFIRKEDIKK